MILFVTTAVKTSNPTYPDTAWDPVTICSLCASTLVPFETRSLYSCWVYIRIPSEPVPILSPALIGYLRQVVRLFWSPSYWTGEWVFSSANAHNYSPNWSRIQKGLDGRTVSLRRNPKLHCPQLNQIAGEELVCKRMKSKVLHSRPFVFIYLHVYSLFNNAFSSCSYASDNRMVSE
jgi:hypothetical protein